MSKQLLQDIQLVTIPEVIKYYLAEQKLSLRCMAEQLDISAAALSNWNNLVSEPDMTLLIKIMLENTDWRSTFAHDILTLRTEGKVTIEKKNGDGHDQA